MYSAIGVQLPNLRRRHLKSAKTSEIKSLKVPNLKKIWRFPMHTYTHTYFDCLCMPKKQRLGKFFMVKCESWKIRLIL